MRVEFSCSECGAVLEADAELGGGISPCPNCGTLLLVPAPAIRPGTTIGGFYIERKLGAGAMGEVYLATQLTIEREVALKVLPPALVQDPGSLERFLREVRLAGSLEHPNIVAVHAAGEDQGVYYLAMSFVRGVSLQDHIEKDGPLSEKRALEITRKIADALAYAWNRHRLVHRDVKPANIMIDEDGEPKLLDLGLAKRTAVDIGMTAAGLVVGTPSFMSPEQADPAREVDFRADMYSLGATLYTLATGKRPFPGKTAQEVLRKVARGLRVEPKAVNPGLSDACNDLIVKMMARKPSQRFTTWEACIAAVDEVLNPGKARPKPRPGGLALRRPVTPPPVQPSPGRPQTQVRRGGRGLTILILLAAAAGAGWWLYRGRGPSGDRAGRRA
ncbi:MAG: protein kinase, partial [Kiritimatiellaeota bacterium]|nr:protein kinase [Kiritimatiellota bacterium]